MPYLRRLCLALLLTPCLAGAASITLPITLTDSEGFTWDIQDDGRISDGSRDAYDGGHELQGFPSAVAAEDEDGGRELAIGPHVMSGLQITRKIYIPSTHAYARFLELVHNPTGSPITFSLEIDTNLGSDGSTVIVGTSSGDGVLDATDDWVISDDDDGTGDPTVTHVAAGPGGRVRPALFEAPSTGTIAYRYDLTVQPGETLAILHFGAQSANRATAQAQAPQLTNLQLDALQGLSATERAAIANFGLDELIVTPGGLFTSVGPVGGSFEPENQTYHVVNSGGGALAWIADTGAPWISITPGKGVLAPGQTTDVVVAIAPYATGLGEGAYHDALTIRNYTSGFVHTRPLMLAIVPADGLLLQEDFDNGAPEWTTAGDWEIGRPTSGPGIGHSPMNAACTRPAGSYRDAMASRLTSPPVYLPPLTSPLARLRLTYNEWLETEVDLDPANLLISTDSGATWTTLSTVSGVSTNWREAGVNLASYAGQVVQLAFDLVTDESIHFAGWHIDDVQIQFSTPPSLAASIVSLNSLNFPYVYMNVAVETNGYPIGTLSQANFTAYENGIEQTERFEVSLPNEGGGSRLADIVFIMDNSGSMSDVQDAVAANVTEFVNKLVAGGINYALGLCRYGQGEGDPIIEDNGVLTTDAEYFKNDVWQRNVDSGATEPGYDAIVRSANEFVFRPGAQKIIIEITDETPEQGIRSSEQDAIEAAVGLGATVFALTEPDLFEAFEELAEVTNGDVFDIRSDFDSIFDAISRFLANSYLVRFRSTDPQASATPRDVAVHVQDGGHLTIADYTYIPRSTPKIVRTPRTRALHTQAWPAGTNIIIEARILDHVPPYTQSADLYVKCTTNAGFHPVAMSNTVSDVWQATVPVDAIVFPGMDYFVIASDGDTSSSDPSSLPDLNAYQLAVLPNDAPQILHAPGTTPAPGTPLTIEAAISDETEGLDVTDLFYRRTGQVLYQQAAMTTAGGAVFSATIPADYVTDEGTDYYLQARDTHGVGRYHGTPDDPHQTFSPVVGVSPLVLHASLPTGGTLTRSVTVTSAGEGSGSLVFEPIDATNSIPGVLRFDPLVGYLPSPGAAMPLNVTFDATGRDTGHYPVDFVIATNDKDQPEIAVSASLDVTAAPDLHMSPVVDFGEVYLGTSPEVSLVITNRGFLPLSITRLTIDHAAYSNTPAATTVVEGATSTITVSFTPQDLGGATGLLSLVSNDPDTPTGTVRCVAHVIPPPILLTTPVSVATGLTADAAVTIPLSLDNTGGGGDLHYTIDVLASNSSPHAADTFGYSWSDSDDAGGPLYHWADIRDVGTPLDPLGEYGSVSMALPFPFRFYGKTQNELRITASGYLTFGPDGYGFGNLPLPNAYSPNDVVAPFWNQLAQHNGAAHVYHDQPGRRFIVQYSDWGHRTDVGRYTFQVQLLESGHMHFLYHTMTGRLDWASVGCENSTGEHGLQIAYAEPYLHEDLAVRITPPNGFVSLDNLRGTVPAGTSAVLQVTLDTAGLPAGAHTALLKLTHNDPLQPPVTIPLQLDISGTPDLQLGADTVDFGTTYIGFTSTNYVRILNDGNERLSISQITTDDPQYVPRLGAFSIEPGGERYVPVACLATATGASTATVSIASSDPDSPVARATLRSDRFQPPRMLVDTSPIAVWMHPGTIRTNLLAIDNSTGAGMLRVNLSAETLGAEDDNYGYIWSHSDASNGPAYSWYDISTIGTATALSGDDNSITQALPFAFNFYGTTHHSVRISCNGFLTFESNGSRTWHDRMPSPSEPNACISPFWDDLYGEDGTNYVYADSSEDRFIVQYDGWDLLGGGGRYTFQVHLHGNGDMAFYYHSMSGRVDDATIGIENGLGSEGLDIAYQEAFVHDGLAVYITAPHAFVRPEPLTLEVPAGGLAIVNLVYDTTELNGLVPDALLALSSNDPLHPRLQIPFQLSWFGAPHAMPYDAWQQYFWPAGYGGTDGSDFDRDGFIDSDEWVAGTDPTRDTSFLGIGRSEPDPAGPGMIIRWQSVSNRTYAIEWTTNLSDGFSLLQSNLPATPAENVYTDGVHNAESLLFYRIRARR